MATKTQSTVVAVFRDRSASQAAVDELRANGFDSSDIYVGSDSGTTGSATGTTAPHHEGGITGWFKSIFSEHDSNEYSGYESAVKSGNVVVSVSVPDAEADRAADILSKHGPIDLQFESEASTTESYATPAATPVATSRSTTAAQDSQAIPVVQEELQVGKRTIMRGGVRVYSRTVSQPVQESVRLQEEHVRVERTPVNREATAADLSNKGEQVFEVYEYAEEAVVGKRARVVEEIRVGKDTSERTETIRDNVRHTEVNVENLGTAVTTGATSGSAATTDDDYYRQHFNSTYGATGDTYETYAPAYRYGQTLAGDPRYAGRSFEDVEPQLRSEYSSRYPNSKWDQMKDSVRYGWNRLTGKAHNA